MKPHELLQRQRQQRRGKAATPPQMRDRNAVIVPQAPQPARRPQFPGETREQELARQRANAPIVRPGPLPAIPAPAGNVTPEPPEQPAITMCGCASHGDAECGHVATLRVLWPSAISVDPLLVIDVCENCASAIKGDPVGSLVTGLAFVALHPPMHAPPPSKPILLGGQEAVRPAETRPIGDAS